MSNKKYHLRIFTGVLSLLVVLMSFSTVYASDADKPLEGEKIVVDPGHGGDKPGAVNNETGLQEKDVTLAVALMLKALLESAGATVIMTRETDVDISPEQRAEKANNADADYFISVHFNSTAVNNTTNYTQGCYYPEYHRKGISHYVTTIPSRGIRYSSKWSR